MNFTKQGYHSMHGGVILKAEGKCEYYSHSQIGKTEYGVAAHGMEGCVKRDLGLESQGRESGPLGSRRLRH